MPTSRSGEMCDMSYNVSIYTWFYFPRISSAISCLKLFIIKILLTDKRSSISSKLSMHQLDSMMKNGTITKLRTIELLSECEDETIEHLKPKVQRINIVDLPYLLQKDRTLLLSMIKTILPLKEVIFNHFVMEPSLIYVVTEILSSVDVFKVISY